MYLVAGGAGFLGENLVKALLYRGNKVRSFDLNHIKINHKNLESIKGDITDKSSIENILEDIEVVFNNIAQVPIAKNHDLFWSVNETGTRNLLEASLNNNISHFVHTSSSAVYGVPKNNPVTEKTIPHPAEDYGRAKLAGENLCEEYNNKGLKCSIVRPRTILGNGRLGIFQVLFEWIYQGLNIPVIDEGKNIYQFIHANDLVDAIISASCKSEANSFNIGATSYGSMYEVLDHLITNSNSKSRIKSLSSNYVKRGMDITSSLGLSPLSAYHALMYGSSMYFDNKLAIKELNFNPMYSNNEMFIESYEWYCNNRELVLSGKHSGSRHQSVLKQKILRFVPYLI
jgi:nucleoside-diphosphate-sugar epimerase